MEKRKARGSSDESAAVKAAAWAWYQHGSGSNGNPTREYDVTIRTPHTAGPSRYKLEAALKISKERGLREHNHCQESKTVDSLSLLDAYEIRTISRHLDSLIGCSSADLKDNNNIREKEVFSDDDSSTSGSSTTSSSIGMMRKKKMNMKKLMRGFWLRHAAAVCSTREDDVVNMAMRPGLRDGRSRPWNITHSR